jgi:hypothetical protein
MMKKQFKSSGVTFKVVNELPTKVRNTILKAVNEFVQANMDFEKVDNILNFIAGGACGRVYDLGDYILKVNKNSGLAENCKDGEIMADLQGIPCIPKLYMYSEDNKYMVVQKIDGQTMSDFNWRPDFLPANHETFSVEEHERMVEEAYKEAEKRGWVMNDCHQYNTMIDKQGRFWVVDVGLFKEAPYAWGGDLGDLKRHGYCIEDGIGRAKSKYAQAV